MKTRDKLWINWRFRRVNDTKRNPGKYGYTPRGRFHNVHAKVAHKVGTSRRAIIDHARYMVNVDKESIEKGKEDLIGQIGNPVEFAKQIGNDEEHYRFMLSPKRGDLINMELFVKNVIKDVEYEIGQKINYAAAIHKPKEPNSAGIYNVHAHLLVQGGFNSGANWFKRLLREAGSREATRQIELGIGGKQKEMEKKKVLTIDTGLIIEKRHD